MRDRDRGLVLLKSISRYLMRSKRRGGNPRLNLQCGIIVSNSPELLDGPRFGWVMLRVGRVRQADARRNAKSTRFVVHES